jgi:hypothetical protein
MYWVSITAEIISPMPESKCHYCYLSAIGMIRGKLVCRLCIDRAVNDRT